MKKPPGPKLKLIRKKHFKEGTLVVPYKFTKKPNLQYKFPPKDWVPVVDPQEFDLQNLHADDLFPIVLVSDSNDYDEFRRAMPQSIWKTLWDAKDTLPITDKKPRALNGQKIIEGIFGPHTDYVYKPGDGPDLEYFASERGEDQLTNDLGGTLDSENEPLYHELKDHVAKMDTLLPVIGHVGKYGKGDTYCAFATVKKQVCGPMVGSRMKILHKQGDGVLVYCGHEWKELWTAILGGLDNYDKAMKVMAKFHATIESLKEDGYDDGLGSDTDTDGETNESAKNRAERKRLQKAHPKPKTDGDGWYQPSKEWTAVAVNRLVDASTLVHAVLLHKSVTGFESKEEIKNAVNANRVSGDDMFMTVMKVLEFHKPKAMGSKLTDYESGAQTWTNYPYKSVTALKLFCQTLYLLAINPVLDYDPDNDVSGDRANLNLREDTKEWMERRVFKKSKRTSYKMATVIGRIQNQHHKAVAAAKKKSGGAAQAPAEAEAVEEGRAGRATVSSTASSSAATVRTSNVGGGRTTPPTKRSAESASLVTDESAESKRRRRITGTNNNGERSTSQQVNLKVRRGTARLMFG